MELVNTCGKPKLSKTDHIRHLAVFCYANTRTNRKHHNCGGVASAGMLP